MISYCILKAFVAMPDTNAAMHVQAKNEHC